jgi:hypothetical protein
MQAGKRLDYCLCRPFWCWQDLVDRNSTNSGLSVPAGLSTCFSYFLPKQLNNVFFIQGGLFDDGIAGDLAHDLSVAQMPVLEWLSPFERSS